MPTSPDQLCLASMPEPADPRACTVTPGPEPDPADYDIVLVGLSGKDAHAALATTVTAAHDAGVFERLYTIHADMGLMEWPGVEYQGRYYPSNAELVAQTSRHYGVPEPRHLSTTRIVHGPDGVWRPQSLLEYVGARGLFPDPARRWCTSDFKIKKISAAVTPLVRALRPRLHRPVRILNVTGIRAQESAPRAARIPYTVAVSNQNRHVDNWMPIHQLSTAEVRGIVDSSGPAHHWAYDSVPGAGDWQGQSRLSCSQCIMGNRRDSVLAARRRPRLARLYAEVEATIGHQFTASTSMRQILAWATQDGGPEPGVVLPENTAEFDALAAAVRAQLAQPTSLAASTRFTTTASACLACSGHRRLDDAAH